MLYGGIELGGTKMVLGISNEDGEILDKTIVQTDMPEETLPKLFDYFINKKIESIGIGSFGPLDLNEKSKTYGCITTTPKQGWENINVISYFRALNVPIGFDTDVNAACIGEVKYGAGRNLNSVIYGTIGTGIGFGVLIDGRLIHGLMHTETGHMLINKHPNDKGRSVCCFHSNCFEGLASGPSIEARWGTKAEKLYDNKDVWDFEAYYIGQAVANCIMCYSPQRIILGGGVMHNRYLLELVKNETIKSLNGYIKKDEIIKDINNYIVLPKLGDNSGLLGSIELGKMKLKNEQNNRRKI